MFVIIDGFEVNNLSKGLLFEQFIMKAISQESEVYLPKHCFK